MRWQSWAEFWAMGGYAVYVWGSVGVTFVLLAFEVLQARLARRVALREVRAQMALDGLSPDAADKTKETV